MAGGDIEIVKSLFKFNSFYDINQGNYYGGTPFHIACEFGRIEIVKLLLNDERVDINKPDKNGMTPFYVACRSDTLKL